MGKLQRDNPEYQDEVHTSLSSSSSSNFDLLAMGAGDSSDEVSSSDSSTGLGEQFSSQSTLTKMRCGRFKGNSELGGTTNLFVG